MPFDRTQRRGRATRRICAAFAATVLAVSLAQLSRRLTPATALPAARTAASQQQVHPADGVLNEGSRTFAFDRGWKFRLVNSADTIDPSGVDGNSANPLAAAAKFDDSAWRHVTLPHDWSIEQLPDPANGDNTGYFPGGLGWYRKSFTVARTMVGKRLSVDFDGVYMNSYVYFNGRLLGRHPYGYTGFSFDITKLVHADGTTRNTIAVVVQNKQPSSRWYSGSGITRNVHLTVTDPVHVTRNGTFVTTPDVANTIRSGYAVAQVNTQVRDDAGTATGVRIVATVRDANGNVVARNRSTELTVGRSASNVPAELRIAHPHLWSTTDPYLYTLHTAVLAQHRTLDTYTTTFGIRWLDFSADGGVSLNGQHLKLHGVDLHNDQGALGSVDNYDALWRQMSILKREGVNAFRTSHNPPSPELIDVCQRLGIVMMVEAFDGWRIGKNPYDYHLYFDRWSDSDIAEMVDEAKNSPAVIMWSIGNEIPGWTSATSLPIEKRLIADIKAIDTSRPVVAGSDQYRSVPEPGSIAAQMVENLDGLGLNYDPAQTVDGLHAVFPSTFFFESESASETSARGIYQDPQLVNTGENYTPGKRLTSSYDNNLASWTMSHEYSLKKDRDRPFFAGQFIWSGFDYIGEPTPYAQFPVKASAFGTIDTAGFPKDAYYLFQSQWTDKPMVHIVPMNWTDYTKHHDVQVEVYTNQKTVELFLNGTSLGRKSFDTKTTSDGRTYLETTECTHDDKNFGSGPCPGSYQSPNGSSGHLHLTWHVPFLRGTLVAVARDSSGRRVARDIQRSAGAPAAVRLTPDRTVVLADGKSLSYVTVDVVDSHGVPVPSADNAIRFAIRGAGRFLGADNGKQDDAHGYQARTHNAFNGKVLAIVESARNRPGPITISATGLDLTPATTTIFSVVRHTRGLVGLLPDYARARPGSTHTLPRAVTAVYADGGTRAVPVRWTSGDSVAVSLGVHEIQGAVAGVPMPARAVVTGYRTRRVVGYTGVVPVATLPALPATVEVVDTDGVVHHRPVRWATVAASRYAKPGRFTVRGVVSATPLPARATIRVSPALVAVANIARNTSPTRPSADASYSGQPSEIPSAMLDGTTSGGWSNYYLKSATNVLPAVSVAHPSEWVSISWPQPHQLASVLAYFTIAADRGLPSSVTVSYWDGRRWVRVRDQRTSWAAATDEASTMTFAPVSTTRLRLDLTSAAPGTSTGFLQISELQVPAK